MFQMPNNNDAYNVFLTSPDSENLHIYLVAGAASFFNPLIENPMYLNLYNRNSGKLARNHSLSSEKVLQMRNKNVSVIGCFFEQDESFFHPKSAVKIHLLRHFLHLPLLWSCSLVLEQSQRHEMLSSGSSSLIKMSE